MQGRRTARVVHQSRQTSLRLSEATLVQLDSLRRQESDLPTRAEMIRRLIDRASLVMIKRNQGDSAIPTPTTAQAAEVLERLKRAGQAASPQSRDDRETEDEGRTVVPDPDWLASTLAAKQPARKK